MLIRIWPMATETAAFAATRAKISMCDVPLTNPNMVFNPGQMDNRNETMTRFS